MNTNPEISEINHFLSNWCAHSLAAMIRHRSARARKFEESASMKDQNLGREMWDHLTDRKNVILSY